MKNKLKGFSALMLAAIMMLSFTGCQFRKADFDVTKYINSVLKCSYYNESKSYMDFTKATQQEAEEYHNTTVYNEAVRFFMEYELDPSEQQIKDMQDVVRKALKNSVFKVEEKTKTKSGFNVVVNYDEQTTLMELESQILDIKSKSEIPGVPAKKGEAYIDSIIELCKNSVDKPTYGKSDKVDFEIKVDKEDYLSLNINLFSFLDTKILPFRK